MSKNTQSKPTSLFGGQAIIEGVLFKSQHALSFAVRKPNGSIYTESKKHSSKLQKYPLAKLPFLRGFFALLEMSVLGSSILQKSAEIALDEPEEEQSGWFSSMFTWFSLALGVVLALVLFKAAPYGISLLIANFFSFASRSATLLVEGIAKLAILILYVWGISFMPDIRRVFMYHGAEHKVIRCFEANKPVTVANVQKSSRYHPRCGTSFLVFVVLMSIGLYAIIPTVGNVWLQLAQRILLLPAIAGISYEFLQFSVHFQKIPVLNWFVKLGFMVQMLTTREPTDDQVEVSIQSFTACKSIEDRY